MVNILTRRIEDVSSIRYNLVIRFRLGTKRETRKRRRRIVIRMCIGGSEQRRSGMKAAENKNFRRGALFSDDVTLLRSRIRGIRIVIPIYISGRNYSSGDKKGGRYKTWMSRKPRLKRGILFRERILRSPPIRLSAVCNPPQIHRVALFIHDWPNIWKESKGSSRS